MVQLFVDISQEIEFPVYDEQTGCYYTHTGTIQELLQYMTDFRHINLYSFQFSKWGKFYEKKRKENY